MNPGLQCSQKALYQEAISFSTTPSRNNFQAHTNLRTYLLKAIYGALVVETAFDHIPKLPLGTTHPNTHTHSKWGLDFQLYITAQFQRPLSLASQNTGHLIAGRAPLPRGQFSGVGTRSLQRRPPNSVIWTKVLLLKAVVSSIKQGRPVLPQVLKGLTITLPRQHLTHCKRSAKNPIER